LLTYTAKTHPLPCSKSGAGFQGELSLRQTSIDEVSVFAPGAEGTAIGKEEEEDHYPERLALSPDGSDHPGEQGA
jgi:hypothetical protein